MPNKKDQARARAQDLLKRGVYRHPSPEWIERYRNYIEQCHEAITQPTTPGYYFAFLSVAENYGIDLSGDYDATEEALCAHADEVYWLSEEYIKYNPTLGSNGVN
jgi:hypothetical protein